MNIIDGLHKLWESTGIMLFQKSAEAAFNNDPSIFSALDGFTYFEDNISLYGHTYPAIAHMVTGEKYKGEKLELNNEVEVNEVMERLSDQFKIANID